jgi:hypothetical protein
LDEEIWLMPDFGYWSWPITPIGNYEQVRAEVKANEPGWEKKIPKAVWRGDVKTNKLRNELLRATRGKDWADVQDIRWENSTTIAAGSAASALSMREHCEYQFLLQTEGLSSCSSRNHDDGSDMSLSYRAKLLRPRKISS